METPKIEVTSTTPAQAIVVAAVVNPNSVNQDVISAEQGDAEFNNDGSPFAALRVTLLGLRDGLQTFISLSLFED